MRFQFCAVNGIFGCGLIGCPAELTQTEGKPATFVQFGCIANAVRGLGETGTPLREAHIEAAAGADVRGEAGVGSKVDIPGRKERVVVLAEARLPAAGVGHVIKISDRSPGGRVCDALKAVGADDGE